MPRHQLLIIFLVAACVRVANVGMSYDAPGSFLVEDSQIYLDGARVMREHLAFVRPANDGVIPETERMPLYIAWLAALDVTSPAQAHI